MEPSRFDKAATYFAVGCIVVAAFMVFTSSLYFDTT